MNHTIVAMVGERVVRVQCNTCGGAHNYHAAAGPKTPAPRTSTRKTESAPRKSKKDPGAAEPVDDDGLHRSRNRLSHSSTSPVETALFWQNRGPEANKICAA